MSDGTRNERARRKHRQRKKELCGCVSLPSIMVESESSVHSSRPQFNEENHFGWSVYEVAPADREYRQLRHQESVQQTRYPPSMPSSPRPVHTGDISGTVQRVDHPRVVSPRHRRNEKARLQHRHLRKEENCCSSVTESLGSACSRDNVPKQVLTEDNNFGWKVFGKAYGDPEFEKIMRFDENPDSAGQVFKKKMHVLYLKQGNVLERDACTSMEDSKTAIPIGDLVNIKQDSRLIGDDGLKFRKVPEDKDKKVNLISEYFFLPTKERSSSRSLKTGLSKPKVLGQLTNHPTVLVNNVNELKRNKEFDTIKEVGDDSVASTLDRLRTRKRDDSRITRAGPTGYLRAGGDSRIRKFVGKDAFSVLQKASEFIRNFKQSDVSRSTKCWEYLLVSPTGANEYLYLSSQNRKKLK